MSEFDELEQLDDLDEDVGLGEDDKKHAQRPDQMEWFKGEQGVSYRVAFVYFHPVTVNTVRKLRKAAKKEGRELSREDEIKAAKAALTKHAEKLEKKPDQLEDWQKLDLSNVQFKKILAHYKQGVGYVVSRLGKDGPESDEVWKRLGEQKKYFTTVVLLYPTNKQGELNKEAFKHGQFQILPWRLSSKVYAALHDQSSSLRANEISISSQDLIVTCTNSEYQNFDKMSAAGKAIWRMSDNFQEKVLKLALSYYDKLQPFRELSTADLRIKLGLESDNQGEDVSDEDMEDLFNNV